MRYLSAALLLALLVIPSIALPSMPSASATTADAIFHDITATASFPEWVSFRLDVESPVQIESAELFWSSDGSPALSISAPRVTPATRLTLEHEIDMTINYLPPGVDIVYFWRVTNSAGHVTESERRAIFYMDERHDWDVLAEGPVTLYWYSGSDGFARDILGTASRAIAMLDERFDIAWQKPIRIIIYGNDRDFTRALPPNSAEWIGGQAYPELNLIFAVIEPGQGAEREVRRMIPHEVSHLMLNQATWNPYTSPPNWLDEGLAVYVQETHEARFTTILDDAVDDGRLIPVRALGSSFPLDPDQALLSYAESWSIVQYIVEQHGDDALAQLIATFRDDVTDEDAVQRSLGLSLDDLDDAWKGSLDYQGDAPPRERNNTQTEVDSDDFTSGERIFALSLTGVASLAGLGLGIYGIRRLRSMRPPR